MAEGGPPADAPSLTTLRSGPLIGICLSLVLEGIILAQCYSYAHTYGKSDRLLFRLGVVVLVTVLLVRAGSDCASAFEYAVDPTYSTNPNELPGAVSASQVSSFLIIGLCQLFFAYRLFSLAGNKGWFIAPPIWIASIVLLVYACIVALDADNLTDLHGSGLSGLYALNSWLEPYWYAQVGVDLFICGGMTFFLLRLRSKSSKGFNPKTDSLLYTVLVLSVANCAVTATVQVASAIAIRATAGTPNTLATAFELLVAPLYAASALLALLWRKRLQPDGSAVRPDMDTDRFEMHTSQSMHVDESDTPSARWVPPPSTSGARFTAPASWMDNMEKGEKLSNGHILVAEGRGI